jgi:hypothetical protein
MKIEVSVGEIVDKLSILSIKKQNIIEESKLNNVIKEYEYLKNIVFNNLKIEQQDFDEMIQVNSKLWKIEDSLREKEKEKIFDEKFIELARSVYYTNDERASIKKRINTKYGSDFFEEKSYSQYQ